MTPAEAWSAVVAGEDAAIFGYSVAGARVGTDDRRAALAGLESHRSSRDRAAAAVVATGGTPPAAAASYQLPFRAGSPARARDLMAVLDNALVGPYADAAAATSGDDRRWAARTAAECAVRAVAWGAEPQAFPTAAGAGPTSGE